MCTTSCTRGQAWLQPCRSALSSTRLADCAACRLVFEALLALEHHLLPKLSLRSWQVCSQLSFCAEHHGCLAAFTDLALHLRLCPRPVRRGARPCRAVQPLPCSHLHR